MRENIRLGIIVLVATFLGGVFAPVGARAAGDLITIVDSNSDSKAQVDRGSLRIGDGAGRLSVDGAVATRDRVRWEPEMPQIYGTAPDEVSHVDTTEYTVPARKKFVITAVSATFDLYSATGQITVLNLVTSEGHTPLPARNHYQGTAFRRYWIYEQLDLTVPAGGTIRMEGTRTEQHDGKADLYAHIIGYLAPA